jgi:hypothetical protein
MAKLLYVTDFVDRCAPPTEDRRPTWIRRCQLWSDAGILPTPTPQSKDSGRRRRVYREETIPLAAVLLRLSDWGIETSILQAIASEIQITSRGRGKFARFWRDAVQGKRGTAYISFSLVPDFYPRVDICYDVNELGLASFTNNTTIWDKAPIFVDLAGIFVEVRNAAEE